MLAVLMLIWCSARWISPFLVTGSKQRGAAEVLVPDAEVHGLCGPDHPNGQEHIVTDLSSLQSTTDKVAKHEDT